MITSTMKRPASLLLSALLVLTGCASAYARIDFTLEVGQLTEEVTVTAQGITVGSNGATVGAGLQLGTYAASLGGSNHGGVTVHIESSNPAIALVAPDATTPGRLLCHSSPLSGALLVPQPYYAVFFRRPFRRSSGPSSSSSPEPPRSMRPPLGLCRTW